MTTRSGAPLRILLLCDYQRSVGGTIVDHVESFLHFSEHHYTAISGHGDLLDGVDVSQYDGIVVHYSLVACYDSYLAPATRRKIRHFQGYKAVFVQDDYRFINDTLAALNYMQVHAIFVLPDADIIDDVYLSEKLPEGIRKVTVLTGYVNDNLIGLKVPAYRDRALDVGYRARKVPAWLGSHTLQKWQIAEKFARDAVRYGLKTDLSCREEDRIYGEAWTRFMTNCKAVLGTESGASVCDFTGEIQRNVEAHVARDPDVSFEALRDLYFKEEDCRLMMNVISPRCFEAAALRTLMIMYEGEYSGVMKPWKHYVPLKMDHSNMDEVVAILRDEARASEIIQSAYADLVASGDWSYRTFIRKVDSVMEEMLAQGLRPSPVSQMCDTAHVSKPDPETVPVSKKRESFPTRIKRRVKHAILKGYHAYTAVCRHIPFLRTCMRYSYAMVKRCIRLVSRPPLAKHYLQDLNRLHQIRHFFQSTPDTAVYLTVSPALGVVELVAMTPGEVLPSEWKKTVSLDEMRAPLRATNITGLYWRNLDPMGIGKAWPFEPSYDFNAILSGDSAAATHWVDALFPAKESTQWIAAAFEV
jgi:hypothetical protein